MNFLDMKRAPFKTKVIPAKLIEGESSGPAPGKIAGIERR
jgi:hypothetical protein